MCPTPWACYLCKSVSAASPITSGHPAQLLRVGVENLSSHITQVMKLLAAGCSSLLRLHKGWRSEEVRLWKSNPQGLLRHFWFMAFLSHALLEAGGRSGDKLLVLPFSRVLCLTFFFFSVLNHFFFSWIRKKCCWAKWVFGLNLLEAVGAPFVVEGFSFSSTNSGRTV